MSNIVMENTNDFNILIIKPNKINNISWIDKDYTDKIINLDIFNIIDTNNINFVETIHSQLNLSDFDIKNINIKNEIIGDEPYYVYEMLYINTEKTQYEIDDNINELGSLLTLNDDKIYSNVIILKSYLPSLNDSMVLDNITKTDISKLLHNRVYTKIVTWDWDNLWKEIEIPGDLNTYVDNLFEGDNYKKLNMDFLMHDINIWYVADNYGDKVCGNILDQPLEKCVWFTMKSEELRGNLTLDEVKKIIHLSKKLTDYKTPEIFKEEIKDKYDRRIIYNKYKVLDYMYANNN